MGHVHSVFLKLGTQKFCTRVKAPGGEGRPSEAVLPLVLGHTRCPALPAGAARGLTRLSRSTCCRVPVFPSTTVRVSGEFAGACLQTGIVIFMITLFRESS